MTLNDITRCNLSVFKVLRRLCRRRHNGKYWQWRPKNISEPQKQYSDLVDPSARKVCPTYRHPHHRHGGPHFLLPLGTKATRMASTMAQNHEAPIAPTKEQWDELISGVKGALLEEMGSESWYLLTVSFFGRPSCCPVGPRGSGLHLSSYLLLGAVRVAVFNGFHPGTPARSRKETRTRV
jgi:hypothetical protein